MFDFVSLIAAAAVLVAEVPAPVTAPINIQPEMTNGDWRRIEEAGVVIECYAGMEDLARQMLPEAATCLTHLRAVVATESDKFTASKDKTLRVIAQQLGLPSPSAELSATFDNAAAAIREVFNTLGEKRVFRMCRKETLARLLRSGAIFPGFTYDAATDTVNFDFGLQAGIPVPGQPQGGTRDFEFPLVIVDDDPTAPVDQARELLTLVAEFPGMLVASGSGALYETLAQSAMISDIGMQSAFRRWFCEGMAHYIGALCLETAVDEATAQAFLQSFDIANHMALKDQVQLLTWRAEEWDAESPAPITGELETAYSAFATSEILSLVSRHGPEVVPAIFEAIAKSESPDEQSILNAIQDVTGEDFRAVLSAYGTNATGHFEGVAVRNIKTCVFEQDEQGEWRLDEPTTTIPIIPDGKHGLCLQALCALASPPATLRVELVRPEAPGTLSGDDAQTCRITDHLSVAAVGWFLTSEFQPGAYAVKVYIDDRHYRDVAITMVPDPATSDEQEQSQTWQNEPPVPGVGV